MSVGREWKARRNRVIAAAYEARYPDGKRCFSVRYLGDVFDLDPSRIVRIVSELRSQSQRASTRSIPPGFGRWPMSDGIRMQRRAHPED